MNLTMTIEMLEKQLEGKIKYLDYLYNDIKQRELERELEVLHLKESISHLKIHEVKE